MTNSQYKKEIILKLHEKEKSYLSVMTRIYVIFVLALYPLYVTSEGYNNIVYRKAQLYWGVTITFFVFFAIFYLVHVFNDKINPDERKFWKRMTMPDWTLLSFMLALTLSFIFSPYKDLAWLGMTNRNDGYLTMLCMTLCYFPISRFYRPRQTDFTIYAIGSSLVCIIGFLQFYGYDFLRLFPYNSPPYTDAEGNPLQSGFSISFRSTIGNIDFLSCYVCMAILVFGTFFIKTKGWRQYLYLAAATMNFALMIIGGADAGKAGTLGAMLLLIPYWIYTKQNLGKTFMLISTFGLSYTAHYWFMANKIIPSWDLEKIPVYDMRLVNNYPHLPLKPILLISLFLLVTGLVILLYKRLEWSKTFKTQLTGIALLVLFIAGGLGGVNIIGKDLPPSNIIYQARDIMHGNLKDEYGTNRGFIWKRAVKQIKFNPIVGTGSDTFIKAFGYENQDEAREKHRVIYDKAHNDFIQILVCNGVFGLLTYLIFIISLILKSVRRAFDNDFTLIALGAVLAYLIQSFFGIDTLIVTPIFWTMLAILRANNNTSQTFC